MRQVFGTEKVDPQKGGSSVLDMKFGPQSGEQTEDPPSTTPQSGDPDSPQSGQAEGIDNPGGGAKSAEEQAAEDLTNAIRDAVEKGDLTVENTAGEIKVTLAAGAAAQDAQEIADALAAVAGTQVSPSATPGDAAAPTEDVAGEGGAGAGEFRAMAASKKLGSVLEEQQADGTVTVERREGAVVVTVGAGGAFISGSADLSAEAQAIIQKLETVSRKAKRIVVTGHTDSTPLGGGTYTDNWELAAARAASVVREIAASGVVPDAELVATGLGDTKPIADNATEEGRAKNRRIEIEIEFEE